MDKCPYCRTIGDCPHYEEQYNCWSKDGKGAYAKYISTLLKSASASPFNQVPFVSRENNDDYFISGSSSDPVDRIYIRSKK